jgi:hypothetical protein
MGADHHDLGDGPPDADRAVLGERRPLLIVAHLILAGTSASSSSSFSSIMDWIVRPSRTALNRNLCWFSAVV